MYSAPAAKDGARGYSVTLAGARACYMLCRCMGEREREREK